jgi:hypothetical protein
MEKEKYSLLAVAACRVLSTQAYIEGAPLLAGGKPLNKLLPDTVEQLLNKGGEK